jgi:hypothetical protein
MTIRRTHFSGLVGVGLLSLLAALCVIGVIGIIVAGVTIANRIEQVQQRHQTYIQSLRDVGIDPTLSGMKQFAGKEVSVGRSVKDTAWALRFLGLVNYTSSHVKPFQSGCQSFRIWLKDYPSDRTPGVLGYVFSAPPLLDIDYCESGGVITWVGEIVDVPSFD